MKYSIVPISFLKPLEKVFPLHLDNLESMIDKDGESSKRLWKFIDNILEK